MQKKQKQQGKVFTRNKGASYAAREVKEQESCPNHQEQDPQPRKLHNVQYQLIPPNLQRMSSKTECVSTPFKQLSPYPGNRQETSEAPAFRHPQD